MSASKTLSGSAGRQLWAQNGRYVTAGDASPFVLLQHEQMLGHLTELLSRGRTEFVRQPAAPGP